MKEFIVMWRIDVNATDHEEAAKLALRELTEGHSKIFEARGQGEDKFTQVDLSDYPEEHPHNTNVSGKD